MGCLTILKVRRCVSEVVASLIVLVIISAVSTTIYNYSLTFMNYNKDKLQEELSIKVDQSNERCKILYVDWNGINDVLNISILNYGDVDVEVVDIYMNGNRIESYIDEFPISINSLNIYNVNFNSSISINQNDLYDIVIVSRRGVAYEYLWRA